MAKLTFKEVHANCASILSNLENKKYAPIYLLMGEEGYYIDLISNYISNNTLSAQEREFNQNIIYGKESNGSAIVGECRRYPVMSSRQVVIVREAQSLGGIEALAGYAASPMSSTILVLCYKGKNLDKRSPLYKNIAKTGVVLESMSPREYEINGWVTELLAKKGCKIEAKAVQMIADFLGADLSKIASEIDKLLTSLPASVRSITADHIEQNIGISKDFNNYELTRAISERDIHKALMIVDHFAANPKENPLLVTISVLFSHFQRIVTLNIYKWEQKRLGLAMGSEFDIAKTLKLPNAYFVNEYLTASIHYPNTKAFPILGLLREWEMKSKGMNAGSATSGEILRELVLRIVMI